MDDASVTAAVKLALLTHRSTSALKTDVDTKDGMVTIRGMAKNQAEKDLVTKLAGDINGVKEVKNEMTVSG
jgi:osmotically-inducible protein OsmY